MPTLKPTAKQHFLHRLHSTVLLLTTLAIGVFAMQSGDAQIQTDAHLWSTETSPRVGAASQVLSSDLATQAMLGIAMIGLAIYFYRFRKLG